MDALEFINERDRMCAASKDCHACFANRKGCIFNYPANNTAKEQVKVLEEWSATHPRKRVKVNFWNSGRMQKLEAMVYLI